MKTVTHKTKRLMRAAMAVICATAIPSMGAGILKPINSTTPARIVSHDVRVTLNNGFAQTEVDQVFANSGDVDCEMMYTFPLPKNASLSELSLWVNGSELLGEVVEKARAKRIYEEQKAQGNDTAMAEKNDFKSFDISVGRVPAGGQTRVRLVYYQPLEIDLNVGRYLYPLAEGNTDDARIPFWSVDDKVDGPFRFDLTLKSAFPVKDVRLPGYEQQAVIESIGNTNEETQVGSVYTARLESSEGAQLNRDIVFYYRLDDTAPARVELIPYRESENAPGTLMAIVTPAADLQPLHDGRDWVFVLDVSGSMQGHKITTLANGVKRVLGQLSPNDRFRIITFNNSASDFTSGYITATPEGVAAWIERVKTIQAGGGTALFAGLEKAYHGLDDDRTTGIILVTDGVCNVGPTQHKAFLNLVKKFDLRLFTFVIGNSANQPLMERLALDTNGFAMNISDADDITGRLIQARAKVLHQSLRNVKIRFSGERITDLTPAKIGSLYAGQQAVLFGRYQGDGPVTMTMTATIGGQEQTWSCKMDLPKVDTTNPELERLWALSQIQERMQKIREDGETSALRDAVVDLGINYSLVTDYTSMIVVEDTVFENENIQKRNADRVQRERKAQAQRAQQAPVSHRVDQSQNTFQGRSAPGINMGTGPIGPLFLLLAGWMRRKARQK
jgi:Ca-activated chloride channel family protein